MGITLSTTFVDDLLEHSGVSLADAIGAGTLKLYASGSAPPVGANESIIGTLLATWTFAAASAFTAPTGGILLLDFGGTVSVTAVATGTADYFRVLNSGAAALIQGLVGTLSSDWNLSSTTVTSGDNVSITGTPSIAWPVA
jgi:hypothetical protein